MMFRLLFLSFFLCLQLLCQKALPVTFESGFTLINAKLCNDFGFIQLIASLDDRVNQTALDNQ